MRIASLEAKKDSIFVIEVSLPLTSSLEPGIFYRPVALTDRAPDSKSGCWGFESLLACHSIGSSPDRLEGKKIPGVPGQDGSE